MIMDSSFIQSVYFVICVTLVTHVCYSESLSIVQHRVVPRVIANCSDTTLVCQIDSAASTGVDLWWTHNPKGNNATELPRISYIPPNEVNQNVWKLNIECATLEHAGKYTCNVANSSGIGPVVRNKDVNLEVFVPIKIEIDQKDVIQALNTKVYLSCRITGYPKPIVEWYKDGKIVKGNDRLVVSVTDVNGSHVQGTIVINGLRREDNGTYTCTAANRHNSTSAEIFVVVQETPDVQIEPNAIILPHSVSISWYVSYTGNLPVKEFIVEYRNASGKWKSTGRLLPDQHNFSISGLNATHAYQIRVAGTNELGIGPWNKIHIRTPAGKPSKPLLVIKVSSSNTSLIFRWERPAEDNGSNLTHYIMQLYLGKKLHDQMTKNTTERNRRHFMSLWSNLEPGNTYTFKVIACNTVGCSDHSDPGIGSTKDGFSEAPQDVIIQCLHDNISMISYVKVIWKPPSIPRGSIKGYNVSLEGIAKYRETDGRMVVDHIPYQERLGANETYFSMRVKPNTNYSVRVCARTGAGCGSMSFLTEDSVCTTPPSVPSSVPIYSLRRKVVPPDFTLLWIHMERASERNGIIRCYRIVMIKLKSGANVNSLPKNPLQLKISTYFHVHQFGDSGAYVAEEVISDNLSPNVVIGDGSYTRCGNTRFNGRKKRTIHSVHDGRLSANTNYSGYVQVIVIGASGQLLSRQSQYFEPVFTVSSVDSMQSKHALLDAFKTEFKNRGVVLSNVPNNVTEIHGNPNDENNAEDSMTVILGSVFGILLALLLLLLGICCYRRYKMQLIARDEYSMGLSAFSRRNGHLVNHMEKLPIIEPITAEDLPAAFILRHKDSDLLFQAEFDALPEKFKDRTTQASDAPENSGKNRYPDIKAYDQTRVKLYPIDGVAGSDYINANFVEGHKRTKKFICAQGPIDKTVFDFWRMIWQHKIYIIVMLTDFEEHGKVKCSKYWCQDGEKQFGNLSVCVSQQSTYSEYSVQKLKVEYRLNGIIEGCRDILHFHFLMWKDFLAPDQPSWLLKFIKRVNENYCSDRGPILIHCSAGVGRTGTFVAIDSLLQELEEDGRVDVFSCVAKLRKERNFLVQSLKQYIFVYRALMEHAQFADTEIDIMTLRDHYDLLKDKLPDDKFRTKMDREYEKLSEVIENQKSHSVGLMDINKAKNRYESILPYDVNRVILPPVPSRDQSSYINASFIQGYDRSLSYIITQDPLESTRWDFWRMVKEQCVCTIVMLSEIGSGQTQCQAYWADQEQTLQYDQLTVKLESTESCSVYNKRLFTVINTKNKENLTVTQFQFKGWGQGSDVPTDTSGILDLITQVQSNQQKHKRDSPLIVHCSGGERSGVYVTLSILIQQMKTEQRVDVFQAARNIRAQRSHMLITVMQYEFLYKALLDYIESFTLCDTQL